MTMAGGLSLWWSDYVTCKKTWIWCPSAHKRGLVAHAFNPSIWVAEIGESEVKVILLYIVSSKILKDKWDSLKTNKLQTQQMV